MSVVEGKPRIRHSHQFEITLRDALPKEQKKTVYDLAVYFSLPPSLGISGTSYQKGNFYEDVQSYIRLKTPEVSFTDIPQGGSGPLSRLNAATLRLQGIRPIAPCGSMSTSQSFSVVCSRARYASISRESRRRPIVPKASGSHKLTELPHRTYDPYIPH